MKNALLKRTFLAATALSVLGFTAVSCVDSDYDLNEDIDMTVGVGAEGLQFKLGSTQKIMMNNVLEVDEDFKLDASNLYYLVKSGSTQSDFNIGGVSSNIEDVRYSTDSPVIDYERIKDAIGVDLTGSLPVSGGFVLDVPEPVLASGNFKYDVNDIDRDIVSLERLNFYDGAKVKIRLQLENTGMDFRFKDMKGMEITVPDFLEITNFTGGTIDKATHTIKVNDKYNMNSNVLEIGEADIKSVYLGDCPITSDRKMHLDADVRFKSDFSFIAASNFDVNMGDMVNVSVVLSVSDNDGTPGAVSVYSAEGKFDPVIEPVVDDIDISSSLPDFLQDDDVTISVANPTFKFTSDMSNIPVKLGFNIKTSSKKDGTQTAEVWIPGKNQKAYLYNNKLNTLYFHQSEAGPYDPSGVDAAADTYKVPNISDLVHKLPDYISVDLSDGKVRVDNTNNTELKLNTSYKFMADYNVYVPFEFNEGLRIVYNDSIDDINEDIQDYAADSAAVSAIVENAVPLELELQFVPLDVNGKELTCIHIEKLKVAPAEADKPTNTDIYVNVRLDDKNDLKKLDKLMFKVTAGSISNGKLNSEQYIKIKDIRLLLKGQIVCDLN